METKIINQVPYLVTSFPRIARYTGNPTFIVLFVSKYKGIVIASDKGGYSVTGNLEEWAAVDDKNAWEQLSEVTINYKI